MSRYEPLRTYDDNNYRELAADGSSRSPGGKAGKKRTLTVLGIVFGVILLAVIIALLVVFLMPSNGGFSPTGTTSLPRSAPGQLLFATITTSGSARSRTRYAARSYNGFDWEAMPDQDNPPVQIECNVGACVATGRGYGFVEQPVPDRLKALPARAQASAFLMQASFGPTKDAVDQVIAQSQANPVLNASQWIRNQMQLTPTLHRDYFRKRSNQPLLAANQAGGRRSLCARGSRWTRYAITALDDGKLVTFSATAVPGRYSIHIDGVLRGDFPTLMGAAHPANPTGWTLPETRRICVVRFGVGRSVVISNSSGVCFVSGPTRTDVTWTNPPIEFTVPDSSTTRTLAATDATFVPALGQPEVLILQTISVACTDVATDRFFRINGLYYRHDPRMSIVRNSLESPVDESASGASMCPSVVHTFVNTNSCVRRSQCSPLVFTSANIRLNDVNLRSWFTTSTRYLYYVTGLRLEDPYNVSPCTGRSRWRRLAGACATPTPGLAVELTNAVSAAITASTDTNPNVVDITLASPPGCVGGIGASITVGSNCFTHVHPNEFDVRDFTVWVNRHDGNQAVMDRGDPNPIARFANLGLVTISFPASHPMSRWRDRQALFPAVGRRDDNVDFRGLPTELQTIDMAVIAGATSTRSPVGFEACGSPGETENDPVLGHRYSMRDLRQGGNRMDELDWRMDSQTAKSQLWMNVVLSAPDQLRQRVAWALAQVLTISNAGQNRPEDMEPWMNIYDIFVRNAFGNYRTALKEVTFCPMMGNYLSYRGNKANAFSGFLPDENYAREIMQLFSVGLWKLTDEGNQLLGPDGNPLPTYDLEDIIDMSRVWTGFDFQRPRGNVESVSQSDSANIFDPMLIRPLWRDFLPKIKLDAGYLGEEFPLCSELPAQHYLKPGATYIYTGPSSAEGATMDAEDMANVGLRGRFAPARGSALYQRLCAPGPGGTCTFPSRVVLDSVLACSGSQECNAEWFYSVKIVDTVASPPVTRYYTYVSTPCVRLTFPEQPGRLVRMGSFAQCADPTTIAYPTCCSTAARTTVVSNYTRECLFANERVTWATAQARCASLGQSLCLGTYTGAADWKTTCARSVYQWTDGTCALKVQVYNTGRIALVDPAVVPAQNFKIFDVSSRNVFRVRWARNEFPSSTGGVCSDGCRMVAMPSAETCVCDVTVTGSVLYGSLADVPLLWKLPSEVHVGAPVPSSFGPGVYTLCTTPACQARTAIDAVNVWFKAGSPEWGRDTVLELPPYRAGGRQRFFFNRKSIVSVGSKSFVNPPHFMPLAGELQPANQWTSDALLTPQAEQEVDALLDHLVEHNATAPFVVYRLIQRMVTSNPSPRYMRTVVNAFRTGTYDGVTFSGRNGDLAATVTAILMDREARSPIVRADPSFGSMREPLLKILHLLRALEFKTFDTREVMMPTLTSVLNQYAYDAPSVFGFYLPQYRPVGPVSDAGLVAPEAQIMDSPRLINFLNGVASLIDQGLTSCSDGFGYSFHELGRNCGRPNANPDGNFTFVPSGATALQVVEQLDELLTAGHLNETSRELLVTEYATAAAAVGGSPSLALKHILKIFVATLEFHTNTANIRSDLMRPSQAAVAGAGRRYKAIVVVFLGGGSDSYNLIVPHSNCVGKDYYAEYASVRTGAAIAKTSLLPINVPAGTQPCDTFGVHPAMGNITGMYTLGEAAFLTNIGALVEPVTKADFEGTSGVRKTFPPSLFAHDVMQRSMHNLHAQLVSSKGILGRTVNSLLQQTPPWKSEMFSLAGNIKMMEGGPAPNMVSASTGIQRFAQYSRFQAPYGNMTNIVSKSNVGETYAALLHNSLQNSEALGGILAATTVSTVFPNDNFGQQMSQVAKLIKMRQPLNLERSVFITTLGGWDTHGTFNLDPLYGAVDRGVGALAMELKAQGVWEDVVVLTVSDFGRTLKSNGAGTDHAWGGQHWIAGGSVKGGQIFGQYPKSLLTSDETNISQGRATIPTTPWEGPWRGIVEWFGVLPQDISTVLPNAANFPASALFDRNELFK